jgi:hypothetical protein
MEKLRDFLFSERDFGWCPKIQTMQNFGKLCYCIEKVNFFISLPHSPDLQVEVCMHDYSLTVKIRSQFYPLGFEFLTAVSKKTAVFWVVAPCRLVEVYHHQGDGSSPTCCRQLGPLRRW